jgi:hypothetical protein
METLHGSQDMAKKTMKIPKFKTKPKSARLPDKIRALTPVKVELSDEAVANVEYLIDMFRKLTEPQVDAMNYVAFNGNTGGKIASYSEMQKMVDQGLLDCHYETKQDALGKYEFPFYSMPIGIHMVWCTYVSSKEYAKKYPDDEPMPEDL